MTVPIKQDIHYSKGQKVIGQGAMSSEQHPTSMQRFPEDCAGLGQARSKRLKIFSACGISLHLPFPPLC